MKIINIIVAFIIAAFSLAGCTAKNSYDYKVTVEPQTNTYAKRGDLGKAAEVLNRRLGNFFNIPQERTKFVVDGNQISLTISNVDTGKISKIRSVISGYNKLEFWETYENSEIIGFLTKANNMLREIQNGTTGAGTVKASGSASPEEFTKQNPLFGILRPRVTDKGETLPSCMIGLAIGTDTSKVITYLKMDQIKALFPTDIKFYWSALPYEYDKSSSLYELHAIRVPSGNRQAPLDGSAIISAKTVKGSSDKEVKVDLTMDNAGTTNWATITKDNINRCIAVVYNGHVRSYPRVMCEISGGNTEITGDFTIEEANDLVSILKSGELPFQLKIVNDQIIKGV
jgi:SecD/SecF fusion protein